MTSAVYCQLNDCGTARNKEDRPAALVLVEDMGPNARQVGAGRLAGQEMHHSSRASAWSGVCRQACQGVKQERAAELVRGLVHAAGLMPGQVYASRQAAG